MIFPTSLRPNRTGWTACWCSRSRWASILHARTRSSRRWRRVHGFDPHDTEAANVWDTIEDAQAFATMTNGMKTFLGAVGFTTLFLGGLGVMNVMLVAVRERTREIGVRKAVGAKSQRHHDAVLRRDHDRGVRQRRTGHGDFVRLLRADQPAADAAVSSPDCCRRGSRRRCRWDCWVRWRCWRRCIRRGRRRSIDPIEALRYEAGG